MSFAKPESQGLAMSIKRATPYLFFNGTAGEAIAHYTRALGAESEGVMSYADMPAEAGTCAPEDRDRVMHASLRIGDAQVMLGDIRRDRPPLPARSNVDITLEFDDTTEQAEKFEALAAGGTVVMKLHDVFWGGKFGVLKDKFGIQWMFTSSPSH